MPSYDVHIYAIARVKVARVEADSPENAARKAEQSVDLHQLITSGQAEYAEDIDGFLVDLLDEAGQRIEGQSAFVDAQYEESKPG